MNSFMFCSSASSESLSDTTGFRSTSPLSFGFEAVMDAAATDDLRRGSTLALDVGAGVIVADFAVSMVVVAVEAPAVVATGVDDWRQLRILLASSVGFCAWPISSNSCFSFGSASTEAALADAPSAAFNVEQNVAKTDVSVDVACPDDVVVVFSGSPVFPLVEVVARNLIIFI